MKTSHLFKQKHVVNKVAIFLSRKSTFGMGTLNIVDDNKYLSTRTVKTHLRDRLTF